MRPRDARGGSARLAPGTDEVRAGGWPLGPRRRLAARPPLERDRRLVLRTPIEDVVTMLGSPAAVAAWFSVTRSPARDGGVVVELPDTATVLHGHETWMTDQHALVFDGERPAVGGFVSLRSVILRDIAFGTEVWVHLEASGRRCDHRDLTALERVVHRGLARMRAELDRSTR